MDNWEYEWDWFNISTRLTFKQIEWMYKHFPEKLDWNGIMMNNNITAEII